MIFDCFTFFNELDLLEVRVHTLAPYVDAFVLAEGNRTFQGGEKPFVFFEHNYETRFHAGKPIHGVAVDLSHLDGCRTAEAAWERERTQRRAIRAWMDRSEPEDSDRLILSDVDEIPDLKIFSQFDSSNKTIIAWHQNLYYYWVNMRCWDWIGPVSCTWDVFRYMFDGDFELLREARGKAECLIDGGWHFSFLGGPAAIKEKIKAFSHTEYLHCANAGNIMQALTDGWKHNRDLFGRGMMRFEVMPDDSHLPAYLVKNKERFKDWWYAG